MTRRRTKSEVPQAWHVMSRGSRRLRLFYEDQDYRTFLGLLCLALGASGCLLWAYALMPNHYHLMIYGTSAALTRCMKRLNRLYACYHNKRQGLAGHAFEGRYKAYLQGSPLLLLNRIAYIFLNPVVAGLAGRPGDYPWSGFLSFMGLGKSPCPVVPLTRLGEFKGKLADAPKKFGEILALEGRLAAVRKSKSTRHWPTSRQLQADQFRWLLDYVRETNKGISEDLVHRKAIYFASQSGIPPRAMADALGESSGSRIRNLLARLRKRVKKAPSLSDVLAID